MATANVTQKGKFFHGTAGYPIRIQLGITLVDLASITLLLAPPNNGTQISRTIPLENIVDSDTGIFDYIPQVGDLSVAGAYSLRLVLTSTDGKVLTTEATLAVA